MVPTNDVLEFCPTDTGSNLLTEIEYSGSADRVSGNKPGVASAKLVNKALRQSALVASQLAQWLVNKTGDDVSDGSLASVLLATMNKAFYNQTVLTKTGAYTLIATDQVVTGATAGGSFALTLPTAIGRTGKTFTIIKTDSTNILTVQTSLAQTIGGVGTSRLLHQANNLITVVSDGANWLILEYNFAPVFACASNSATFACTTGATIKVPVKISDVWGAYDTSTGAFTVPANMAGNIRVGFNGVSLATAANTFLNVNGASVGRLLALGAGGLSYGEIVYPCAAGDVLSVYSDGNFTMDYTAPSGTTTGLKAWLTFELLKKNG